MIKMDSTLFITLFLQIVINYINIKFGNRQLAIENQEHQSLKVQEALFTQYNTIVFCSV